MHWSIVRAGYVVGFLVGTTTHAIDLLVGGYSWAPPPLAVFFAALVVLDPLTAVLVALGHRHGVTLAFAVIVLDLVANWYVNWPRLPGALLHPTWLLLNVFSLFVLVTWLPLRRHIAGTR
ncbi:hypothetical protein [Kutzneria kofuensis]|uniref:Uncharacterized protein n=1 Tax=Kutzneria kofuensis TaxID=103725 RepID=A0A7W9NF36_9PSEU|nr:hypothetical protein [Kutzneria kofuensis]MBB5890285.1 hypothetical protein [Kutzneria kofuensis]